MRGPSWVLPPNSSSSVSNNNSSSHHHGDMNGNIFLLSLLRFVRLLKRRWPLVAAAVLVALWWTVLVRGIASSSSSSSSSSLSSSTTTSVETIHVSANIGDNDHAGARQRYAENQHGNNNGQSGPQQRQVAVVNGDGQNNNIERKTHDQASMGSSFFSAPHPADDGSRLVLPRHAALEGNVDENEVVYYPGQDSVVPRDMGENYRFWSPPPGSRLQLQAHREIDERKMRGEGGFRHDASFLPEQYRQYWRPHYAGADDAVVAARWAADDAVPPDSSPLWQQVGGDKRKVVVLMWDGFTPFTWGQGAHVGTPNYAGYMVDKPECPVDCQWTGDRKRWSEADALVFDVCLTGPTEFRQIPVHMPERLSGQQWWWFAYEQQYYFPMMREPDYMRRFDSKLLYHYDSSVHTTFTCPWGGQNTFLDPPPPKSKDKVVAAFLSNCNTGGAVRRTEFLEELRKYVKVDSFGGCKKTTNIRSDQDKQMRRSHGDKINEKIGVIREYKFLLAFENNDGVDDYVTEKLTNAYQAGTVPVYWGSPTVDRWTIGNYSIIRTTDFASPRELGEFLSYLNENDSAYSRYFDWKKHGISEQYQRLLRKCIFNAECDTCKRVAMAIGDGAEHAKQQAERSKHQLGFALRLNCLDCRDDRGDQYVQVPNHASLALTSKFTIAAWIQLSVIQDGRIVDKNTAGRVDGFMFDVVKVAGPAGVVRLCAGGTCVQASRPLHTGIWYHVAVTFDASGRDQGIKFYVNGHLDCIRKANAPASTNALPLRFGRAAEGGWSWRPHHRTSIFDGTMDDVAIFSTVLTEQDIFELMFARLTGKEQYLVGFWGFDEGSGTQVRDVSSNNNHGTISGGAQWVRSTAKPLTDPSVLERPT